MILTEDLNYRDHALTKDIVRKMSCMYNLLHMIKSSEQEDPPQERSALILVWTNFRTIVANILNNKLQTTSILSDMTCQDLCTLAECIKRTNLTINFSEIEDFCQEQDENLMKTEFTNKQSSQYKHLQKIIEQNISLKMFAHTDKNR